MNGMHDGGLGSEKQEREHEMARGLNRAMLIGIVEREPEIRHTADGTAVTAFSVSTARTWTTTTGQPNTVTDWFGLVAWGALAEIAVRHLAAGQRLFAEGHLVTRSWDDALGRRQVRTELVADRLIPLDGSYDLSQQGNGTEMGDSASCLNRVMLIGNLGRDPDMRYTPAGQAVTAFSLTTTRTWLTPDGERQSAAEWFNVVCWGALAEVCNQHLAKGRRVYVEGELRNRTWRQADGQRRFRTELVASNMILLGPR